MNSLTVLVVGLAAYRATLIFTRDKISTALRNRLFDWAWTEEPYDPEVPEHTHVVSRGPIRSYVYTGLTCPWCLGVWTAGACYSIYRWGDDGGRALIVVLAAAAVQAFLTSVTPPDE